MFNRWAVSLAVTLFLVGGAIGLHKWTVYQERAKAVAEERDRVAAQANQEISERRVTDAKFDRMDAMELCRDAGLQWVAIDGRSYCAPR